MQTIPLTPTSTVELIEPTLRDDPRYSVWVRRCKSIYDDLPEYYRDKRPYQWEYPAIYCLRNANIFAGSMGIGKTLITLIKIKALYLLDRPNQVHIVVPNTVLFAEWQAELDRVLPGSYAIVRTESQLERNRQPIILYTYDLPRSQTKAPRFTSNKTKLSKRLSKEFKPSLLVLDEIHRLGKQNTLRYSHLLKVRRAAKRVLGLSGTPAKDPQSVHMLCQFVYQTYWPYSTLEEFKTVFVEPKVLQTHFIHGAKQTEANRRWLPFVKFHKLPEWGELIQTYIHRATLDDPDVKPFISYPELSEHFVPLDPSGFTHSMYHRYIAQHKDQIQRLAEDDSRQAEALNLCCQLIKLVNFPAHPTTKLKFTRETLSKHKKVLIFTKLKGSARYLAENLNLKYLNSDIKPKQREELIAEFKANDDKALILSYDLAAEGLNLTMVDAIIHYCLHWDGLIVSQANRRAARPGNRLNAVEVYYPHHTHMVDQHQLSVVYTKIKASQQTLDFEGFHESIGVAAHSVLKKL